MMKKLLVMLIMLAAVSSAAVLELSIDGVTNGADQDQATTLYVDDTIVIDVYCSGSPNTDNWWMTVTGPGSLAGTGTVYAPPAPGADVTQTYTYGWYHFVCTVTTHTRLTGKWWDEDFTCTGEGEVVITLWDENASTVEDTITITQIPEPMTVALLGLAGLFLRRRK